MCGDYNILYAYSPTQQSFLYLRLIMLTIIFIPVMLFADDFCSCHIIMMLYLGNVTKNYVRVGDAQSILCNNIPVEFRFTGSRFTAVNVMLYCTCFLRRGRLDVVHSPSSWLEKKPSWSLSSRPRIIVSSTVTSPKLITVNAMLPNN